MTIHPYLRRITPIDPSMRIDITLPPGGTPPANAHATDTGYDLVAASGPQFVGDSVMVSGERLWRRIDYIEYDTGISVKPESMQVTRIYEAYLPPKHIEYPGYLLVYPRSSLSKTNLILANSVAVIDHSYRGTIKLRFRYVIQPADLRLILDNGWTSPQDAPRGFAARIDGDRIYQRGDKIGQAVAAWKEDIHWSVVESLDDTVRGAGGFGSSGT